MYDQKYHQKQEQQKKLKVHEYRQKRGGTKANNYTQMKVPFQNVKTIQNTIIDTSQNSISYQQELQHQLEAQEKSLEEQKLRLDGMRSDQSNIHGGSRQEIKFISE